MPSCPDSPKAEHRVGGSQMASGERLLLPEHPRPISLRSTPRVSAGERLARHGPGSRSSFNDDTEES